MGHIRIVTRVFDHRRRHRIRAAGDFCQFKFCAQTTGETDIDGVRHLATAHHRVGRLGRRRRARARGPATPQTRGIGPALIVIVARYFLVHFSIVAPHVVARPVVRR